MSALNAKEGYALYTYLQKVSSDLQAFVAQYPVLPSVLSVSILGEDVKDARKALKLTQQEFADLAGVGRRFISELEAGKETLEIGKVLQVCRAAGIDILAVRR